LNIQSKKPPEVKLEPLLLWAGSSAMRRPIIAANWKMNLGRADEAVALVRRLRPRLSRIGGAEVVLCPPVTVLAALAEVLAASPIALGAQNMHWQQRGAHTGEIAPTMLVGLCRWVLIGHSERRASGGASDDDTALNRKLRSALEHGLRPILCIGESAEQRAAGDTRRVLRGQLESGLDGLTPEQAAGCVVAYEPIWAIGSGRSASATEANRVIGLEIRGAVADRFGEAAARSLRVLYGGSVDRDNVAAFIVMPEVDGALVGGASLDLGFAELVERAASVWQGRD
jgi:triosephosphate isomerase